VCLALALLHGFSINIHGRSNIGVAHQFLLHFERSPSLVQKTPESVAERVQSIAAVKFNNGGGLLIHPALFVFISIGVFSINLGRSHLRRKTSFANDCAPKFGSDAESLL
jgi:hypothetical protein